MSAYERGTKSPTLAVVERILLTLGVDLALQPRITFHDVQGDRGRTYLVPDQLWRVDPPDCFAPLTVRDAEGRPRTFDLLTRESRVDAYAWLLQHGDGNSHSPIWTARSSSTPGEMSLRACAPTFVDCGIRCSTPLAKQ